MASRLFFRPWGAQWLPWQGQNEYTGIFLAQGAGNVTSSGLRHSPIKHFYRKLASLEAFLSVLSGLLMSLSFPRYEHGALAFVALVPLLYALQRQGSG